MAISNTMRKALHALSQPANIDVGKTYKVERVLRTLRKPVAPSYHLWDHTIVRDDREILVRIYPPQKQTDHRLLLFFHGGGWVLENIDTYNTVCRNLAAQTGCRVVSVEYSLAPEHTFPVGLEDCYIAAREIFTHPDDFGVEPDKITLIGDSAGGNLAAAVSLLARDRKEFTIAQQILIYPATYNDHSPTSRFDSVRSNGTDYLLTAKRVNDYMKLYAGDDPANLTSAYFAPLLAKNLNDQPRTLVITAEYDPLRDEGEAYAHALHRAGNDVMLYRMPDALHGYFSLSPRFKLVRQTYQLIDCFLNGDADACQSITKEKKL